MYQGGQCRDNHTIRDLERGIYNESGVNNRDVPCSNGCNGS